MEDLSGYSTPPDLIGAARDATLNLLPATSKKKYLAAYDKFILWKNAKNARSLSENVSMAYFYELSSSYQSSSLWSKYSQLKKKLSIGHKPKKSKILSANDVEKFLNEAQDEIHLATKVGLTFEITGGCRPDDLCKIIVNDVTEHDKSLILVKLNDTKTHIPRSFTITDKFFHTVKKYMQLRPENCKINRFFLNYQKGKCLQQPIGIHKFGSMPSLITSYLQLPDAKEYTGHAFRGTSATLLVESGADITTLKCHGAWKSDRVAEGYIENSINNKNRICDKIGKFINLHNESGSESASTSKENELHTTINATSQSDKKMMDNTGNKNQVFCQSQTSNTTINNHQGIYHH